MMWLTKKEDLSHSYYIDHHYHHHHSAHDIVHWMTMNDSFNLTLINSSSVSSIQSTDLFFRKFLLGFLLLSLAVCTIFGNLLVLYALRTEKRLRTVSNLFILSLALADLIVGLVVMPLSTANIILGQWPFSYLLCQIWLSIDYVAR